VRELKQFQLLKGHMEFGESPFLEMSNYPGTKARPISAAIAGGSEMFFLL
jgi:hypothetical protein